MASPEKPNILWICTDQQRWDTIHALGNPHIRTPNLDHLVDTGVAFDHAFCQSPICTPSRASFLTGLYPSTVHNTSNEVDRWSGAAPLVTKILADTGYDCGLAGKLHLSGVDDRIEPRPDDGYREFHWSQVPDDLREGHPSDYADWLDSRGQSAKELFERHGYIPVEYHQTTWCAHRAIDFIRSHQHTDGPWLFSLNTYYPHPEGGEGDLYPPSEFLNRFDVDALPGPAYRESDLASQEKLKGANFQTKAAAYDEREAKLQQAKYWATVELIDQNVGRVLDALEETGQRETTIVIFMSDHGETLGDHGLRAKGCRFYEGLIRVPLIVSWPVHFLQGLRSPALIELTLTDIAPTLLDAAGVPVPDGLQGKSLMTLLTGSSDPGEHREYVRCEYYAALGRRYQMASVPAGEEEAWVKQNHPQWAALPHQDFRWRKGQQSYATMIRTRRFKLVNYHGLDCGELFDLETDPNEFDNLWNDPNYAQTRFDLTVKNFDALAFAVDTGCMRTKK